MLCDAVRRYQSQGGLPWRGGVTVRKMVGTQVVTRGVYNFCKLNKRIVWTGGFCEGPAEPL